MSGGSLTQAALDEAIAEATAKGFEVVRGNDTTLLCDLDSPAAIERFHTVYPLVEEYFGADDYESWESKSGNMHVLVKLNGPLHVTTRLLLQAALGSDGKREL